MDLYQDSQAGHHLAALHVDRATLSVVDCTPLFAAALGYESTDACASGFFAGPHLTELTRLDLLARQGSIALRNRSGQTVHGVLQQQAGSLSIVLQLNQSKQPGAYAALIELFPEYGIALVNQEDVALTWLTTTPLPLGNGFCASVAQQTDFRNVTVPEDYLRLSALFGEAGIDTVRFICPDGLIQPAEVRTLVEEQQTLVRIRPVATVSERNHKILLVEDDALVCRFMSSVLTAAGYEVLVAEDVPQADGLLAAQSASLTLMISDLNLPNSADGAYVASVRERYPDLQIITCSGHPDPGLSHAHLVKPVEREDLLSLIEGLNA